MNPKASHFTFAGV